MPHPGVNRLMPHSVYIYHTIWGTSVINICHLCPSYTFRPLQGHRQGSMHRDMQVQKICSSYMLLSCYILQIIMIKPGFAFRKFLTWNYSWQIYFYVLPTGFLILCVEFVMVLWSFTLVCRWNCHQRNFFDLFIVIYIYFAGGKDKRILMDSNFVFFSYGNLRTLIFELLTDAKEFVFWRLQIAL